MSTQALQPAADAQAEIIEKAIVGGDLSKLSAGDRTRYYQRVCESVGLNPYTRPFEYITLNGKLTLYARKDCTDQLRKLYGVSVQIVSRERVEDAQVVTARATTADGRSDESIGAVSVKGLSGDALCNAIMKAETKAKRRVTLSICGLGMLDESESETIPGARTFAGEQLAAAEAAPPGEESEHARLVAEIKEMCVEMNAKGHQPPWSGTTLKTYVSARFPGHVDTSRLGDEDLRALRGELSSMLDALVAAAEQQPAEEAAPADDDMPY